MVALIDLTGRRFGMLVVLKRDIRFKRPTKWLCQCDCGAQSVTAYQALADGRTKSCGCQKGKKPNARHLAQMPEYKIYRGIIQRCENPARLGFENYGARGISICAEWRESFDAFLEHIGPRPSAKHSVERIDNDKGYEPGNVRWALPLEQANNKVRTRYVTYRGKRMSLHDAVRSAGSVIHPEAAWVRISRCGWSVAEALETDALFESPNSRARRARRAA